MSKIKTTTWPIEPHTEAKLIILKKYLDAWLPIMTSQNRRVVYIDGFAGPGEYENGKDGSPIIALKSFIQYKDRIESEIVMTFIESDSSRCDNLKRKLTQLSIPKNFSIEIVNDEFVNIVDERLKKMNSEALRLAPSFVFIDPFGFKGIPIEIVRRIMEHKKCEVLINFMYEDINRFLANKRLWNHFEKIFGTEKWKRVIALKNPQERNISLHDLYKGQLKNECNINHVYSFRMKNKRNKTDYYLFFGTNHSLGLAKMKEAMWQVDPTGNFEFSDVTYNPNQPTLFSEEVDLKPLMSDLLNRFKNKKICIKNLIEYVITQTPYLKKHLKTCLRELERNGSQINRECLVCSDPSSCKKKRYCFRDSCVISFCIMV